MSEYARQMALFANTVSAVENSDSGDLSDEGEPPSSAKQCDKSVNSSISFRKKYYPSVTQKQWNDWHWQLSNRITTTTSLARIINLSHGEIAAISNDDAQLPFALTPYYLSLLEPNNENDPLRMSVIPRADELNTNPLEENDPLSEECHEVVPGLVHRYPDRVLFLVTNYCSTYCRYCTRSRVVGSIENLTSRWQAGIDYIENHSEIRDVLISGGDPLTLSDDVLEGILTKVRAIPHVEFIRIGTKIPTVLPQRVTPQLTRMLKKFHPLFISIHATHAREFTPEAVAACGKLADAGIPLGSQTVLLKGINDELSTMKELMHRLLMARVRPYYLYQCDPVKGTAHFRTSVNKGLEIIAGLRGYTSGYAVPTYVIDSPGGGGKIPISANNICGVDGNDLLLVNFEGKVFRYPQVGRDIVCV